MTTVLLHTSVLDAIAGDIVAGRLPAGHVITLDQLQTMYHASRGLVRECMRIFEGLGMLRSQRRTGISVQPESAWNVSDARVIRWRLEGPDRDRQLQSLTELRLGIEPVAARLAALRATETERDELREASAMMRANGDAHRHDRHLQADIAFHTLILRASHNEMYAAMAGIVREVLSARRNHGLIAEDRMPAALRRHQSVAEAILDGREDDAEAAMHELLAEVRASVHASSAL